MSTKNGFKNRQLMWRGKVGDKNIDSSLVTGLTLWPVCPAAVRHVFMVQPGLADEWEGAMRRSKLKQKKAPEGAFLSRNSVRLIWS